MSLSAKDGAVDEDTIRVKHEPSPDAADEGGISSAPADAVKDESGGSATNSPLLQSSKTKTSRSSSSSTVKSKATSESSADNKDLLHGGRGVSVNMETTPAVKPSRSTSQKGNLRAAPLFDHSQDSTMEAKTTFTTMETCTYANKFLGYAEHAMECDCAEEWGTLLAP